ncbi:hypothetical protein F4821DRAFT_251681 [Hypoxylon rubiginosum]|uniref:Uncharacterized protein n=1 Tax=Hypoxylon rubiginosum TaxID=110542 RepID=A0ACC0CJ55_9PEZI|nr:hypothetical protein F4821DRAFT_251681 [Hypoxylon rubiginosum]
MESQGRIFHLFPLLPPELRIAIWQECLPHLRVTELQRPLDTGTYMFQERRPCKLLLTTCKNSCPPAISRVCRESRAVAFRWGGVLGHDPDGADKQLGEYLDSAVRDPWLDAAHDVIHMNYENAFKMDYRPNASNPLRYLAKLAAQTTLNQASFNLGFLLRPTSIFGQITKLLRLRPSWLVVVYVAVVHMDSEVAAARAPGLFGMLCDAPVQIVDLRDEERLNAFNALARATESNPSAGQHVDDESLEQALGSLDYALTTLFKEEQEPAPAMYPAVMFRLCTERCYEVRRGRKKK